MTLAVLPARSTAVAVTDWSAPSPVRTRSAGQIAMPDSASEHVKWTVGAARYQPAAFLSPITVAAMSGTVVSMLMSSTVAVAVVPAPLTAVPETLWLAASVVTVTGSGQVLIPDCVSLQVNVTVTGPLFQPSPLAGVRTAVMSGLVLSMLTVTVTELLLPALSTAVPVTT